MLVQASLTKREANYRKVYKEISWSKKASRAVIDVWLVGSGNIAVSDPTSRDILQFRLTLILHQVCYMPLACIHEYQEGIYHLIYSSFLTIR
jgi:hypothetical protein